MATCTMSSSASQPVHTTRRFHSKIPGILLRVYLLFLMLRTMESTTSCRVSCRRVPDRSNTSRILLRTPHVVPGTNVQSRWHLFLPITPTSMFLGSEGAPRHQRQDGGVVLRHPAQSGGVIRGLAAARAAAPAASSHRSERVDRIRLLFVKAARLDAICLASHDHARLR